MKIELLDKDTHLREDFDCGVDALNKFLKEQASSAGIKKISRTNVLVDEQRPTEVVAYYTLNFAEVSAPVDSRLYKKYPHKLPALLLSRLATDKKYQGQGHGEYMLIDAICAVAKIDIEQYSPAPVVGLVVDAKPGKDEFYKKQGFLVMDEASPTRQWLPIGTCVAIYRRVYSDH